MSSNNNVAVGMVVAAAVAGLMVIATKRNQPKKIPIPPKKLRFRICVYCGSRSGTNPKYEQAAIALGKLFYEHGVELVYGGGSIGLMGAIAKSVHNCGGMVHSVIPKALINYSGEAIQPENYIVTKGMHDRKQCFHDLCDAFIALPGGLGTMEELLETATWMQIGVHNKPFGVLNVDGFFAPLRAMFAKQVQDRFMDEVWEDGGLVFNSDPEQLLKQVLHSIELNKASNSQISAQEWNV
ncbi:hypothetical protein BASA81_012561 [Batrachochytrium salamandrivorans]|nr:hypothetical protein BASA81_012561 [Batrachochytrium salamandrivorans]